MKGALSSHRPDKAHRTPLGLDWSSNKSHINQIINRYSSDCVVFFVEADAKRIAVIWLYCSYMFSILMYVVNSTDENNNVIKFSKVVRVSA